MVLLKPAVLPKNLQPPRSAAMANMLVRLYAIVPPPPAQLKLFPPVICTGGPPPGGTTKNEWLRLGLERINMKAGDVSTFGNSLASAAPAVSKSSPTRATYLRIVFSSLI